MRAGRTVAFAVFLVALPRAWSEPTPPTPPPDLPAPGLANEPVAIAGYDRGLYIATRDDAFRLGISGWLQARWELEAAGGDADHRFTLPVARILLAGHAFTRIDFVLSADGGNGTFGPFDAYIDQPVFGARLRFGQFRPFFSQQQLTHRVHLELTDRPITFGFAGINRDLGVSLHHEPAFDDCGIEWALGVYEGTGIAPVPAAVPGDARPLVVARLGWTVARADPYHEADLDHDRPRVAFGVGYAVDLASGTPGEMRHDVTADLVFKGEGWSITTAGFLKSSRATPFSARRTDYGWHAQIGRVIVPRLLGVAGRFAELRLPGGNLHEIAAALDIYRRGHALKWQIEGTAIHDTATSSTTWVGRVQTQLLF